MTLSKTSTWLEAAKAAVISVICATLVAPQAFAETANSSIGIPAPRLAAPLTQQQKVLHTLNRFTFGPRPGDEQAAAKMGLDAWFDRQLHPETIDDSDLEARMDAFPAMRLSQADLLRRFPSPAVIRQMAKRGDSLPSDPVERAIYGDAIAAFEAKTKDKTAADAKTQKDSMTAPDAGMQEDGQAEASQTGDRQPVMPQTADAKGKRQSDVTAASPEDVQAVLALSPDERMQRLISMQPAEMLSFRAALKPRQRLEVLRGLTPEQIEIAAALQGGTLRVVGAEALESRLVRDVYSERQLQAVMTDFWLNHFSVYAKKSQNEPYYLASYENETVLPNALGKFEDLLVATAESPAMLMYLDNWQSIGPDSLAATRVKRLGQFAPKLAQAVPKGLNENYARELMELHTLGVNGGYTQKDVIEVAKCFSGWTIDRPYQGGGFRFEPNRHEGGSKVVLGRTIPEGGMNEGLTVLHMLATNPATAKFISNKLAVRFVSDTPPPALVDRMAATFLRTNGDIKAVMGTMFHSQEFSSPEVYRAKLKTPIEFMASALRASDAAVNNPLPLVQAMEQLGMPIYGMQTPNGYSWQSEPWASSNALVSRMNFAVVLSGSRLPGTRTDWPQLLGEPDAAASPATEHKLETLILGGPAAERTRTTVLQQASNPDLQKTALESFALKPADESDPDVGGATLKRKRQGKGGATDFLRADLPETPLDTMAGLLLGSPDFQRR